MKEVIFYDFDLELNEEKKWGPIFDIYANYLPKLKKTLEDILEQFEITPKFIESLYNMIPIPENNILFYNEICYIAKRIGISLHKALLMQLVYETSSACTTTLLKIGIDEFFFRTMDWKMLFLKDVTIGLNIKRGTRLIGKTTTWLGYVGFLTATNTNEKYTICINYRRTKNITFIDLTINLYRTVTMKWPIGYLVRYIIENNLDVYNAKKSLENSQLISPCYITLYVPGYQTYIITRDCDKLVDTRTNELIQTNCDWNKKEPNILWSLERIKFIKNTQNIINKLHNNQTSDVKNILKLLLKFPVINEETIYVHFQFKNEYSTLILI